MAVPAALADHGPQPQRDLAERLEVHPSDVVKVLDGLSRAGYVDRERDTADRRRVLASISTPGRRLLGELTAEVAAVRDDLLAPLDEAEQASLHALLLRVHTHAASR
ncbi:MarR family transcriptional regulator [Streptomyces sp. NPDC048550]|uniref:MarR family transcriptional regulator n=1 Tax=Streptomyces sp. NPDC048550 TaxID=3155739 RepID=UPI00342FE01F